MPPQRTLRVPSLNKIHLAGVLSNYPETYGRPQYGNLVCRFGLKNEDPDHPLNVDVVVLGPASAFCTDLRMGQAVLIEGRLGTRAWTDPDGKTHSKTEVQASWVELLEA